MIVYGDPAYEIEFSRFAASLRDRLQTIRSGLRDTPEDLATALARLDGLRMLLIQTGQLEQAVADTPSVISHLAWAERSTFQAAQALVAHVTGMGHDWRPDMRAAQRVRAALDAMSDCVSRLLYASSERITVKIPEGFAFYALYPEQYVHSAVDWIRAQGEPATKRAVVVGIRSIGTTLSAIVSALLVEHGWHVHRLTARPTGHPFDRHVDLHGLQLAGADRALVVDEGPGLSGSSMAAAAEALWRAGVDRTRISFLPGHEHAPGPAASPTVREWWADVQTYVTPLHQIRWAGRSLEQLIAEGTTALQGTRATCDDVDDFSAGQWRSAVFDREADWPAACVAFERTKYRCRCKDGRQVVWKFAGLACGPNLEGGVERERSTLHARADAGWTVAPLGDLHGFVITPWIQGRAYRRGELAAPGLAAYLGRYIVEAQGPIPAAAERHAAWKRLDHMLYWNTREMLGGNAAEHAQSWSRRLAASLEAPMPAYGDGRMGPQEWLQTSAGRSIKLDCGGHMQDHTMVGIQPVVWDLAGALVEWDAEERAAAGIVTATEPAWSVSAEVLAWYRAAYAAFRMGQCAMGMESMCTSSPEHARMKEAVEFYRGHLRQMLAGSHQPSSQPVLG